MNLKNLKKDNTEQKSIKYTKKIKKTTNVNLNDTQSLVNGYFDLTCNPELLTKTCFDCLHFSHKKGCLELKDETRQHSDPVCVFFDEFDLLYNH